jgi:hypothetical protein
MDVADYKHGATAATQDTKSLVDQLHDAAKASDKTAMAMARAGAEAENAKRGVKNLAGGFDSLDRQLHQTDAALKMVDVQIGKTRREIELLALQAAATGDIDIFKSLRSKRSELGALNNVKKELTGVKNELEKGLKEAAVVGMGAFRAAFSSLGPMLSSLWTSVSTVAPQIMGAIIPILIGIATALAPLLGAIIGGGILTGIGLAGIGAGIAGVFSDPRIKQSASALGSALAADFRDAASSFIGPTLKGIGVIGDALHGLKPDLKGIFGPLSTEVVSLAHGLGGLATQMMPGLRAAVVASLPVIQTLARELPQIGMALSDMFKSIASGGAGAQQGMQALFDLTEMMIRNLGTSIGILEKAWSHLIDFFSSTGHALEPILGWLPVFGDHLRGVTGYWDHLKQSLADNKNAAMAAGAVGAVSDAVTTLGGTAKGAVQQMQDLRAELDKIQKSNFDARSSQRALEAAIDDGTKALQKNGKELRIGTAAGRANQEALDKIASSANAAADAVFAQTGSQEQANAMLQRGRSEFIKLAQSMGMSAGEARRLAGALFTIPNRTISVTVQNKQALSAIARVQQDLRYVNGKDIHIGVYYDTYGNLKLPGGTQVKNERGGVYDHAASGLLREAATYSPQGPARYAFAEPSTGGEAFIPKRGNMERSRSIWGYVGENWLGMQRAPQYVAAGGGGSSAPARVIIDLRGGNDEMTRWIRSRVRIEGGGDVQVAFGDH